MTLLELPLDYTKVEKIPADAEIMRAAESCRQTARQLAGEARFMDAMERTVEALRTMRDFSDFENTEFRALLLTVLFDLVVAIEIGMVLACLLFIKRMSEETHVNSWTYVDDDTPDVDEHLQKLPLQIRVYEISGPLFFGAASAIEHIVVKDFTTCLVLRMRSVPALDSTAMNALVDLVEVCESKGITVVFSHVNEQPMKVMEKAGFTELVGKENFQPNISAALKRAEEVIAK